STGPAPGPPPTGGRWAPPPATRPESRVPGPAGAQGGGVRHGRTAGRRRRRASRGPGAPDRAPQTAGPATPRGTRGRGPAVPPPRGRRGTSSASHLGVGHDRGRRGVVAWIHGTPHHPGA